MYTAPTPPLDAVGFGSEQFLLLVRGWRDSKSRLRIAFRNAFCTVLEAREGRVAFWIGAERDKNAVDFVVAECFCGFRHDISIRLACWLEATLRRCSLVMVLR